MASDLSGARMANCLMSTPIKNSVYFSYLTHNTLIISRNSEVDPLLLLIYFYLLSIDLILYIIFYIHFKLVAHQIKTKEKVMKSRNKIE